MTDEITVKAEIGNLHQVLDHLVGWLEKVGCTKKTIRQCKLCAEEVFMNISSYAYRPETGFARLRMEAVGDGGPSRLVFTFSDTGMPFDPLSKEAPDINAPLQDRPIGGLGIFLVKNTMDNVAYEYKDGHNVLTMEKRLA